MIKETLTLSVMQGSDNMEKLPLFKLTIKEDENSIQEVNAIALVDVPAINETFFAFEKQIFVEPNKGERESDFIPRCIEYVVGEGKDQEQAAAICYSKWENKDQNFQESYSDYPKQASENAKVALRWADENGWGECGTPVGKARANQLAKGEAITRDTIARMAAFERHRQNSQKELGDGCGRLMWLAWGGDAGIEWAQRKLEQIDRQKMQAFSVVNSEERIVVGPAMIPDMPIFRKDETGEYYVFFDKKTIETIALKFYAKGFQQSANEMHTKPVEGITFFMSWIADESKGIPKMKQFENLPDGTWFLGAKVMNDETWAKVKDGTFKGFSVEGMFDMTEVKMRMKEEEIIEKLKNLLKDL
jgi:hypothetical protein